MILLLRLLPRKLVRKSIRQEARKTAQWPDIRGLSSQSTSSRLLGTTAQLSKQYITIAAYSLYLYTQFCTIMITKLLTQLMASMIEVSTQQPKAVGSNHAQSDNIAAVQPLAAFACLDSAARWQFLRQSVQFLEHY